MSSKRTPVKDKVQEIISFFINENPDYFYLKNVFKQLREELNVEVITSAKKAINIPSEEEIRNFYQSVWEGKNFQDIIIIKTLLYTGVRVNELVDIRIGDIDFINCTIRITEKQKQKDRYVPFPDSFKEVLGMQIKKMQEQKAIYLFESSRRKKKYSDRGIRKILERYTKMAGMKRNISPKVLRHFLIAWLKKKRINDELIKPYSGHHQSRSLLAYSKVDFKEAKEAYDTVIDGFPV